MINAYDRAFSAILDSNVTAAITGVILYLIGTEDVKGFGLTLYGMAGFNDASPRWGAGLRLSLFP